MKKIALLLLTSILFPVASFADSILPDGCYVSYQNPNYCYEVPTGQNLIWTYSTDSNVLVPIYGQILATIIGHYSNEVNQCSLDYNNLLAFSNAQARKILSLNKQIKKLKKR